MSTVAVAQALAQPLARRGQALLELTEDQWFDRKSAKISGRDLADRLIGFANAEGGTVLIGLAKGVVEGTDAQGPQRLNDWQQAAVDFSVPPIRVKAKTIQCVNDQGAKDHLVVLEVETS